MWENLCVTKKGVKSLCSSYEVSTDDKFMLNTKYDWGKLFIKFFSSKGHLDCTQWTNSFL